MEVRKEEALHQSLLDRLRVQIKECGVLGAGGAGFPTYAKLDVRCETIILNCAECEPLLKVHQQVLSRYTREILEGLSIVGDAVLAKEIVIGVKEHYHETIEQVKYLKKEYPKIRLHLLKEVYPMGDEVVLTYEVTHKVVPTGGIPIDVGVAVFNVETILNLYHSATRNEPVTHKYVTVTGGVATPTTLKVPIGMKVSECISLVGGITIENYRILMGGPMTGRIVDEHDVITKTTNGIIVLPSNNPVIKKLNTNSSTDMKKAFATCCQCEMCTDMCPRNQLGLPVSPSTFMRGATSTNVDVMVGAIGGLKNSLLCCSCGVCELYACPQGLSPRKLIGEFKSSMRKNGIIPPKGLALNEVHPMREYRKIPMERLMERLDLIQYNDKAPLYEKELEPQKVRIPMNQHIGAKSIPSVKVNDIVKAKECIAIAKEDALSLPTHASISGVVTVVDENYIEIKRVQ